MKWIALFVAVVGLVPWLAKRCAINELWRRGVLTVMTWNLFHPLHINFFSDENYRGDSRGFEVTSVDLLALAIWGSQLIRGERKQSGSYFLIVRAFYLGTVLMSLTATPDLLRSMFSVWKLVRMYFLFSVLSVSFRDMGMVGAALDGLGLGVFLEGVQALWQKYVYHMVRVTGSQSHPNSLAMIVNFISPIAFSLLLANKGRKFVGVVVVFAAMCDVFTLSRGGMLMFAAATVLVITGSMLRGVTGHKIRVVAVIFVGGLAALAKSMETILKRFYEAPKESELARKLFNMAAKQMADDHSFGVGINMYSWVLDHGGYADRIGIEPGDRNGIAHHIYWLTTAELGYIGVTAYLLLLFVVLLTAMRLSMRKGLEGDLGLGIVAGLVITYTQGTAEWIARQTTMAYCFWILTAIVAGRMMALKSQDSAADQMGTPT